MSVDLKKAFDRIEHAALFRSLEQQGLDTAYISLLRTLYPGQIGDVGEHTFPIRRGVR